MGKKYLFDDYYIELKKYYEKYGNLLIPINYEVEINDKGNKKTLKLGQWIHHLRGYYNGSDTTYTLTDSQIKLLEDIGMVWSVSGVENTITYGWLRNYNLAKKYYEKHGNLLIPTDYKEEIEEFGNKKIINLGKWISTQRRYYNNKILSDRKKDLLNDINMIWDMQYYIFIHNSFYDQGKEKKMLKLEKIVLETISKINESDLNRENINNEIIRKLSIY